MTYLRAICYALVSIAFIFTYITFINWLTNDVSWGVLAGIIVWQLHRLITTLFKWAWPKRSTYDTP